MPALTQNTNAMNSNAAGDAVSETSSGQGGNSGRVSVEKIYQKKTQLEHILLRPDTYIGSVEPITQPMWVYDGPELGMRFRPVTFTPGLFKIFDEILVNAADNKQRDPSMKKIMITVDREKNQFAIWNDGKGVPVQMHKTEKVYVPSLIFGHLLTSSNFDDTQKKVTGGRNGFGAKLCNVFSKKFTVETSCKANKKRFKQTWTGNMAKAGEPTIVDSDKDFTCVTFEPDLEKFKMESLDDDTIALFTKRAFDMCATAAGVSVYMNGKKLPVNNFKDYIDLYLKSRVDDDSPPPTVVHEKVSPRWEVAVCNSEKGFQQISFVNSIATTKGGTHVNSVVDQLVDKLLIQVGKRNKDKVPVKPFQVKNQMWVFINCLIENPTFDSQTKENMTLQIKKFGSKCELNDKFLKNAANCGIVDNVIQWLNFKAQKDLNKKGGTDKKQTKLKGIPKLDDANEAGGKNSTDCTLILTEGDSAKSLAVSGLGVIGRDRYGVFPLRGKLLNVRESNTKQILDNKEINNIMKIVGLQPKKKYDDVEDLKCLRYGKIMIMTDQDQDGSHIKGLLINMVHYFWPSLVRRNFLDQFITPIVKASKGKDSVSFYSLPEFDEWRSETPNWKSYSIKYYKGLGTSTMKEAKEYFSDMERHRIHFKYAGSKDDDSIELGFSKAKISERKEWLLDFMDDRRRRRDEKEPDVYLYRKDTKNISYSDFIHKELVLFSNTDTERSIPNVMDGLKPGQRKVIFTCLLRKDKKEVKVAQLAGSVAEKSAYHHGEASLMSTIINLAQNYVGSNNLNLLLPIGQFGTRLQGGKDAASPRYIFTMLNPVSKILFNPNDDPMLAPQFEDNQKIEPEFYCPVIPLVLINGAEGIGTGWSTKALNHDVRDVIANLKRLLNAEDPLPMVPSYKNFEGAVRELESNHYSFFGNISVLDHLTVEITELPVGVWTQTYKENVLETMLLGNEKEKPVLTDYKEYHTDVTVKFVITLPADKLTEAENAPGGLHKFFKLNADRATTNMVLFDSNNCIKRYESTLDILKEFYVVRLGMYDKRKKYLVGMLTSDSEKLSAMARFILEKIDGTIVIENKLKKKIIQELITKNYPSDPVRKWKEDQSKKLTMIKMELDFGDNQEKDDGSPNASEEDAPAGADFNYILGMPLWSLTKERKDELLKQRDDKLSELSKLQKSTVKSLWTEDLDAVLKELEKQEKLEQEEDMATIALSNKSALKKKGGTLRAKQGAHVDTKPSENARLVEPPSGESLKETKAAKAGTKRGGDKTQKAGKSTEEVVKQLDSDEELVGKSLTERLNDSGQGSHILERLSPQAKKPTASTSAATKAKEPAKRKLAKPDSKTANGAGSKQMKLTDGGKGVKVGAKKKPPVPKKRDEWNSDSESGEEDEVSDVSFHSDEDDFVQTKPKTVKREPIEDSDHDFDENEDDVKDEEMEFKEDDDFEPSPPEASTSKSVSIKPKPVKKLQILESDEEDDYSPIVSDKDSEDEFKPPVPKVGTSKPAASKPKAALPKHKPTKILTNASDSEEQDVYTAMVSDRDSEDDYKPEPKIVSKPKQVTLKPKAAPAAKPKPAPVKVKKEAEPKKKKVFLDSSEDEDDAYGKPESDIEPGNDDDDSPIVTKGSRPARDRKKIDYKMEADSDDVE